MKQFILTTLLLITLTLQGYSQSPATNNSYRDISVFNNLEFFYNVTSPDINLKSYLLENDFSLDIKNSTPAQEVWMYNEDTLKQLFILYFDCSKDQYAWTKPAGEIYLNQVSPYITTSCQYTTGRNFRSFWLFDVKLPVLTYEILTLVIPYGQPIYEKDFNENERLYKKYIN